MITLGELSAWLLVALVIAWLWRSHGVRERALAFAQQHCENAQVQLLDGNVAFKGWQIITDGRNQKRLARIYGFEFTVTSRERLSGTVAMFGHYLAGIELQAYPEQNNASEAVVYTQNQEQSGSNKVVKLSDWRGDSRDSD